jgi:hypothetical protein
MPIECQRKVCVVGERNSHELEEQPSPVLAKQLCQHCGMPLSHQSRCALLSAKSCADNSSSAVADLIFRLHKERNLAK